MQEAVAAVAVAVVDVAGIAVGDIVWVAVTAVERRTVGLLLIYKAWKNLFADRSFLVSFSLDLMFMTTVKKNHAISYYHTATVQNVCIIY